MTQSGIDQTIATNIVKKFHKYHSKWEQIIDNSFLCNELKEQFKLLIDERLKRL